MINKASINDDITNDNNKLTLEKKLSELLQLLCILIENNIISSYMKSNNIEEAQIEN
jgi:hypothetical protein